MKTKLLKNILLSSAALFLLTACGTSNINSSNNKTIIDPHNSQNSLDWTGYYKGILPCASCPGIETSLKLKENNNEVRYELKEKYLEEKDALFITKGIATWEKNSSILVLQAENNQNRKIFIGKNYVTFDLNNLNNDYILKKIETNSK